MSKIPHTPAQIPANRGTAVEVPVDPELREALAGLAPAQLEEVLEAGRQTAIAKAAEIRGRRS